MDLYDIRYNICLYLDIEDFLRFIEVSKLFRLMRYDSCLWKYFMVRDFNRSMEGTEENYRKLYEDISRKIECSNISENIFTKCKIDIKKMIKLSDDISIRIGPEKMRWYEVSKLYEYIYHKRGQWMILDKYREGRKNTGVIKFFLPSYVMDYLEIRMIGGKAMRYFFSQVDDI